MRPRPWRKPAWSCWLGRRRPRRPLRRGQYFGQYDHSLEMDFHSVTVGGSYEVYSADDSYPDNTGCTMTDPSGEPDFMTFEDGSVAGNFTYNGIYTCWMGLFRAHIGGSVFILNNRTNTTVPGIAYNSPELATNVINGKLVCTGNKPKPAFGDSHGKPSIARKGNFGQCKHHL